MSGAINAVANAAAATGPDPAGGASLRRQAPNLPSAPGMAADRANVASVNRGSAPGSVGLGGAPEANFARMARGFHSGSQFEVGGTGFFGSSFVGGEGSVAALSADRIDLNFHITAPSVDRRERMCFRLQDGAYVARDGAKFDAAVSDGGNTVTLTNQANRNQRVVFHSESPGVLNMTSFGFDPAGNGKTIQFTAK